MSDLLIKLYGLPDPAPWLRKTGRQGTTVRRARADEKSRVAGWVREVFGPGWAGECEAAFCRQPVSCFIAVARGRIVGFACHEATCRGFFGPVGVAAESRGRGIGAALLVRSLHAMAEIGYAYAIVGDGGAAEKFYARVVEVQPVAGSDPGIYRDRLSEETP